MDFDSILRNIYKSKTFYELEKCAECIYESYYLDRELNQIEKEELCRIAEKQGNRILCFMADPDTYDTLDKRYMDEEGNIVYAKELRAVFDSFTDEEKAMHNNNFRDYVLDCMNFNGGTLTKIF